MKSKHYAIIGVASFWILTACGQGPTQPEAKTNSSNRSNTASADSNSAEPNADLSPQQRSARLEELKQEKAQLEAERAALQADIENVSQQTTFVQSQQNQQVQGIPAGAFQGAAFLDKFDLAAVDLAAFADLIQAAMDGDVAGIIDALMDLAADLAAEIAVIDDAIAKIQDLIADLI